MSCSKCSKVLKFENTLQVQCAECGDCFHAACLTSEELSGYFKQTRECSRWHCPACDDDSDSIREELRNVWGTGHRSSPRPAAEEQRDLEVVAEAMEVLDTLMQSVNEDGTFSGMDQEDNKLEAKKEVEEEDTSKEAEKTQEKVDAANKIATQETVEENNGEGKNEQRGNPFDDEEDERYINEKLEEPKYVNDNWDEDEDDMKDDDKNEGIPDETMEDREDNAKTSSGETEEDDGAKGGKGRRISGF